MDNPKPFSCLALPDDEVHLWYVFPNRISSPEVLQSYQALLSREEATRHQRYLFDRNRQQFLVARALVRTTLSRYAGALPTDWGFVANGHGKPAIAAPKEFSHLQFNLSHTDGLVACAVTSGHEVGVDVEDVGRREISTGLARYCLSASELAHWEALPAAEQREVFFDYWTLKEAYMKARGLGLSLRLHDFSFHLRPGRAPAISFVPGFGDDPGAWQFAQFRPSARHRAAVAVRRPNGRDLRLVVRETVPVSLPRFYCT
ncbi:MAG: 4'-phosphopantetheinyl transferase superfamily protein [Gemmataceae bacterium]|nr:4'-phosphopantetheinyl transferase superfamily protein [Gemmataceae bacterium]